MESRGNDLSLNVSITTLHQYILFKVHRLSSLLHIQFSQMKDKNIQWLTQGIQEDKDKCNLCCRGDPRWIVLCTWFPIYIMVQVPESDCSSWSCKITLLCGYQNWYQLLLELLLAGNLRTLFWYNIPILTKNCFFMIF